jgi:hypothetical protein
MTSTSKTDLLQKLGLSQIDIVSALKVLELKRDTVPVSYRELISMNEHEMSKLLSLSWKDGRYQHHCYGVDEVSIDYREDDWNILRYFDYHNIIVKIYFERSVDLIDNVGNGQWNYGLYRKI